MSSVGSFFSYINDARSHEPEDCLFCLCSSFLTITSHKTSTCVHIYFGVFFLLFISKGKGKGVARQAEVAKEVPGRLRLRIFLTFRHYKGGRSSAKRTGRFLPQEKSLALTFRGWLDLREHGSVGGTTEKIPSDTTGNRSRDRPTSSAEHYSYLRN